MPLFTTGAKNTRAYPNTIRVDQGSEFVSRDLDIWTYQKGVVLELLAAGQADGQQLHRIVQRQVQKRTPRDEPGCSRQSPPKSVSEAPEVVLIGLCARCSVCLKQLTLAFGFVLPKSAEYHFK
jgi:hypothetical protein